MYALIEFAGKQFRVEEGSSIRVPHVDGKVGSKVSIAKILYMDDGKKKTVGTPLVAGVSIDSEIISHGRDRKVVVFKFKRRKGYQKKNTHRQDYSILKVGKLGKVKKTIVSKKTSEKTDKEAAPKKSILAKKAAPKKAAPKKAAAKKSSAKKPTVKKATPAKPKETKE